MDECRLRRARTGRGWALDDVIVTASAWDSMTSGRGAPSIAGERKGERRSGEKRSNIICARAYAPGGGRRSLPVRAPTRSSRAREIGPRQMLGESAPRYVRTDEP